MCRNPRTISEIIRVIRREDKDYPERLTHYPGMPELIYVKGDLPDPSSPTAAIVGSRSCSSYGRIQAFRFARELSRHGVQIISGLALGIDAESHRGALAGGTPTFAVLGSGADVCYPASNYSLYERILQTGGGIISEFSPGSEALSWHFPIRNRIISALADLVLVIEARKKSGSLITAGYAIEQGKTVYALPGAVHDPLSQGTNRLIFDGAGTAIDPEDILQEFGITYIKERRNDRREEKTDESPKQTEGNNSEPADRESVSRKLPDERLPLTGEEGMEEDSDERDQRMILDCFCLDGESVETIMKKTGLPLRTVQRNMMELKLCGKIREPVRNQFIRDSDDQSAY